MALRQIDIDNNALPSPIIPSSDRPVKKLLPISIPKTAPTMATTPVTDENNPPPAADAAIEYTASEDLEPLADPEMKIQGLVEELEAKDWIKICEALNDVRRFAVHHSALLLPILEKVVVVIVKSVKNPRSALCKTSIMAAADVFVAFGDGLLVGEAISAETFDNLLLQLLLKASQDKKFVCEEADRALKCMVVAMTPLPLLHKLKKYITHTNPRIRAKASVSVSLCVSKMGLEGAKEFGLVSLVQTALEMLNDRLPEAREAARSTLIYIYGKFTENEEHKLESWQTFCETNLTAIQALSAIKVAPS